MTDEEILALLVRLNDSARLVIHDGPRTSLETFNIVNDIGYHEPTTQFVFRVGIKCEGDDRDSREQVQWASDEEA